MADKVTDCKFFSSGAQIILVNALPIAILDPALGLINAGIGAWPIDVATPFLPL